MFLGGLNKMMGIILASVCVSSRYWWSVCLKNICWAPPPYLRNPDFFSIFFFFDQPTLPQKGKKMRTIECNNDAHIHIMPIATKHPTTLPETSDSGKSRARKSWMRPQKTVFWDLDRRRSRSGQKDSAVSCTSLLLTHVEVDFTDGSYHYTSSAKSFYWSYKTHPATEKEVLELLKTKWYCGKAPKLHSSLSLRHLDGRGESGQTTMLWGPGHLASSATQPAKSALSGRMSLRASFTHWFPVLDPGLHKAEDLFTFFQCKAIEDIREHVHG